MALGRSPDYAINHDPEALALHAANHPETVHLSKNIYKVDPIDVVGNRAVGLLWASPDCKHFSKAKGGKPVKRTIRDLAWTVVLWAQRARPRVIILENVEEFKDWGPLTEKEPGKFTPCPERKGQEFTRWVHALKRNGYKVQWRELRACDYGAPTTRKRLFVIARRDGKKIVWPAPTHGAPTDPDVIAGKKLPWVTAAEIIDWSIPCPSIFDTSEEIMAKHGVRAVRPLADNTMARIAKGIKRYVLDAAKPFLVSVNHGYSGGRREYPTDEPMRAVTSGGISEAVIAPHVTKFQTGAVGAAADAPLPTVTANSYIKRPGGAAPIGVVAAHLSAAQHGGSHRAADEPVHTLTASPKDQNQVIAAHLQRQFGASVGHGADEPNASITAGGGGKSALVAAFLAQHNTDVVGHEAREPVSTIVQKGSTQAVVSAGLMNMKGSDRRMSDIEQPIPTICADGNHVSEVRAFLMKYYGNEQDGHEPGNPLGAVTTRDRFGLVTVEGEQYQITDIGMRMLTPRELFKAQGFPPHYQIENGDFDGEIRPLTKTAQVRIGSMTIDIIEAAKADRQTKLDTILSLQLDVIEIDQFIAKARSYAGQGETDTTAPNPLPEGEVNPSPDLDTPAEAKTVDREPSTDGSGGVQDECAIHPATPIAEPVEAETTAKAQTKYDLVVEAVRKNPDATNSDLAEMLGLTRGTASVYGSKARRELGLKYPPAEPRKAAPAPKAPAKPETRHTIPNEPIRPVHNVVRQRPKGTMFRLRNEDGLFLHCDLNAMIRKGLRFVGKHEYPWEGSERQLLAVRKMLPATIDLREEVITNG
eukprot:jgi/Tetstr1/440999/TSEL_029267.t1